MMRNERFTFDPLVPGEPASLHYGFRWPEDYLGLLRVECNFGITLEVIQRGVARRLVRSLSHCCGAGPTLRGGQFLCAGCQAPQPHQISFSWGGDSPISDQVVERLALQAQAAGVDPVLASLAVRALVVKLEAVGKDSSTADGLTHQLFL